MHFAFRYTMLLLIVLGPLAALHAQEPAFQFEHLQIPGGSDANVVISIAQDAQGFMWFGTWQGLHRYDGYAFTAFTHDPGDSTSLSSNWVESLFVDRTGTLWVGTYRCGLNRFDPNTETFTHYRHDPEDPKCGPAINATGWHGVGNSLHGRVPRCRVFCRAISPDLRGAALDLYDKSDISCVKSDVTDYPYTSSDVSQAVALS